MRRTVPALLLVLVACVGGSEAEPPTPAAAPEQAPPAAPEQAPAVSEQAAPPDGCGGDPFSCRTAPELVGTFDPAVVGEASGLAASRRTPGAWYLLDDGPGTTGVQMLAPDAGILGTVTVAGLDGTDTEDLAVGPCGPGDPTWCVYVGDIGDNAAGREAVQVWRFPEPGLVDGRAPEEPVGADVATLTYPDGPVDAEALLVDTEGVPYLVTKSEPARLLGAPGFADGVLVDHGVVPVPKPELPFAASAVGNVVTGGDAVPGRVLLRTYDEVVEYVAPALDAPLSTLPTWTPQPLPSPGLPQSEAVAYSAEGCGWATVSEGVGDLWLTTCG